MAIVRVMFDRLAEAGDRDPELATALEEVLKSSCTNSIKIVQLWDCMWWLLAKATAEESDIKESEWLEKARAFGHLYATVYCPEDVTPYIHVFVYHVGFYLEKYPL
eukprot:Phypoly_transcript_04031.p6 GENE.Phypoly_transcript_04031~~Phypoly_transcript_04031.p6  ORF type:complete len:106 (-),score=11.53 Phypoly_transcript_04031:1080-1397(-)